MCGTVYGEMHLKDLLGSFVRVGYRIPFPDFYLVLHGLPKKGRNYPKAVKFSRLVKSALLPETESESESE